MTVFRENKLFAKEEMVQKSQFFLFFFSRPMFCCFHFANKNCRQLIFIWGKKLVVEHAFHSYHCLWWSLSLVLLVLLLCSAAFKCLDCSATQVVSSVHSSSNPAWGGSICTGK